MTGGFMRVTIYSTLALCGSLFLTSGAYAQSTPTELADLALEDLLSVDVGTNVDGEKKHKKWEFNYSYRKLDIGGYKTGTNNLTFDEVLFSPGQEARTQSNYPVVPTYICQSVNAVSAKYNFNGTTSLSVIVPYIYQESEHISSVPGFADFTLISEGIGDVGVKLSRNYALSPASNVNLVGGIRIPTGSINETGDTPRNGSGTLERMPYTMQNGSGTIDLTFNASYQKAQTANVSWGVGSNVMIRTGKNKNDYRLGNNYGANSWVKYTGHEWFRPGLRLSARNIESIKGLDLGLTIPGPFPFPASITDPDNYGGTKAHIAVNTDVCLKASCDISMSFEYGKPIYLDLNGVQPKDQDYVSIQGRIKI